MSSSILNDVKSSLGIDQLNTSFDVELLIHINSNFGKLLQVGIGKNLIVKDNTTLWADFLDEINQNESIFQMIKQYIYVTTRLAFDPPQPTTFAYFEKLANELLVRMNYMEKEETII